MTDPHTRRGHYPVRTEEELDAIVKEMRVEAPSDEAVRHRIGNPINGDGAVAGDIDGDHGEIGGPLGRQCLEYLTLCINVRGMPPVLSGDLCVNELAPGLDADEIAAAPPYDQPRQPILPAIIVAAQPAIVVVAAQRFPNHHLIPSG